MDKSHDDRIIKKYKVKEIKEEAGSYTAVLEDGIEIELFYVSQKIVGFSTVFFIWIIEFFIYFLLVYMINLF